MGRAGTTWSIWVVGSVIFLEGGRANPFFVRFVLGLLGLRDTTATPEAFSSSAAPAGASDTLAPR